MKRTGIEEFGPRYQNSPARLAYERERAAENITDDQYIQMTRKFEGTEMGNILEATAYINGIFGKEQDFSKALMFYTRAAEQGSADAMYNLGIMNEKGMGIPKNIEAAISWWRQAIKKDPNTPGVIDSYASLGNAYRYGDGVPIDGDKAIKYWEKAAQYGYDVALNNLGCTYEHGIIAPRDIDKARMYYNAAAMKGAVTAMYNLGILEVREGNAEKGAKWLRKAAEHKHPLAENALAELPDEDPLVADLIAKYRAFNSGMQNNRTHTRMHSVHPTSKYPIEQLIEWAPKSRIARDLLKAKLCSFEALEYLHQKQGTILGNIKEMRTFATLAAGCYKITEIVFEYQPEEKRLVMQVLRKLQQLDPDNTDAMLGLMMATEDISNITKLTERWISQGKIIPRMYEVLALFHLSLDNLPESLQAINKAIKEEPNDAHYFVRGSIYRMVGRTKEGIADFDTYLENIDSGDRKIPNAHFGKAQLYAYDGEFKKAEESFIIGCRKDEEALPFFKHREATQKEMTQKIVQMLAATARVKKSSSASTPVKKKELLKFSHEWEMKYKDVRRVEIVTRFREVIRSARANPNSKKVTTKPRSNQPRPPPSVDTLKPILLEDMEYKDKVYEGFILSGKIIEAPAVLSGTYTLIEDEQGQVQKIGFYNFDISDEKKAKEYFWLGKRISIINPYMRIGSSDNKPFIRVDVVESVISHPCDYYSACALCQSLATMRCGRCHMTSYCSKRCQEIDWKTFKHKLICA